MNDMKGVDSQCRAFQAAVEVLGRPWNALILNVLQAGPLRFSALSAAARGPGDKILSANVVQFVRDKPVLFALFHRLLSPGGQVATTYQPRHRGATAADAHRTAEELKGLMAAAGFAQIRIEELQLKPVPVVSVLGSRAR